MKGINYGVLWLSRLLIEVGNKTSDKYNRSESA